MSHGWLTLNEIKEWPHWDSCTQQEGVIDLETLETWDRMSRPPSFCGGVWGKDVVIASDIDAIDEHTTHVRVRWTNPTNREQCKEFWKLLEYIEVREYYDFIRFVFGFDS